MMNDTTATRFAVVIRGEQWQTGRKRGTRVAVDFFVTGISWAEGTKAAKFTYGTDPTKAATFSRSTAESLVEQFRGPRFRVDARIDAR